jgi:hypothetical protein
MYINIYETMYQLSINVRNHFISFGWITFFDFGR